MSATLMKCGCISQGTNAAGKPVCVVHVGILPGAEEPAPVPDLSGRWAFCHYCGTKRPSNITLPFFEFGRSQKGVRNEGEDDFYCGCRGWD